MFKQVNAVGDACPIPVIKTKKALEELIRQREEQSYERTGKNKDHIPRT